MRSRPLPLSATRAARPAAVMLPTALLPGMSYTLPLCHGHGQHPSNRSLTSLDPSTGAAQTARKRRANAVQTPHQCEHWEHSPDLGQSGGGQTPPRIGDPGTFVNFAALWHESPAI